MAESKILRLLKELTEELEQAQGTTTDPKPCDGTCEDCNQEEHVMMAYNERRNELVIFTSEDRIDKKFLKYLIEAKGLPSTTKVVFVD